MSDGAIYKVVIEFVGPGAREHAEELAATITNETELTVGVECIVSRDIYVYQPEKQDA